MTIFEPAPQGYPYKYVPIGTEVNEFDELVVTATDELLVVPDACSCDPGAAPCFFPLCIEIQQDALEAAAATYVVPDRSLDFGL